MNKCVNYVINRIERTYLVLCPMMTSRISVEPQYHVRDQGDCHELSTLKKKEKKMRKKKETV